MILKIILNDFNKSWSNQINSSNWVTISPSHRLRSGLIKIDTAQFNLSTSKAINLTSSYRTKRIKRTTRKIRNREFFGKMKIRGLSSLSFKRRRSLLLLKSNTANRNKIVYLYVRNIIKTKSVYRTSVRILFTSRKLKARIKKRKRLNFKRTKLKSKLYAVNTKTKNSIINSSNFVHKKRGVRANLLKSKLSNRKTLLLGYNTKLNSIRANRSYLTDKHSSYTFSFKSKESLRSLYFTMPRVALKIVNSTNKLLLNYVSLFIKFRLITSNFKFRSKKFLIKKAMFSFLKPNESKRNIMNRRKRINSSRLYRQLQRSNIHTIFKANNKLYRTNNRVKKYLFDTDSLNTKLKEFTLNKESSELFLPRVKFKPGYQRIWRQARKSIAENIGLRYVYQKQMTKFMSKLSRKTNFYSFSMSESSLDKAMLYSRLLPDLKIVNNFLNKGLISLNGWKVNNLHTFVLPGDVIQVSISKWLCVYYRWLKLWSASNKSKFRKLVFRKGLASSYKLMKQRKQRSRHVPLWINNSRFDISDIKPNFEVDFFTMSSFMLYEPLLIDYYSPDDLPDQRHYIYRLYNWKYIT